MSIQSIHNGQGPISPPGLLNTESGNTTVTQPGLNLKSDQTGIFQTEQQKPSAQQLKEAVKSMNDFVGGIHSSLNFSVDDKTGQTIVKVMDSETQEVIKQIPSEDMLAMAQAVDKLKGLLVHQKA